MRFTTTKPARTWDWPRTHRVHVLSNDAEGLSQRRFCADCIIATPGYDFQEGQGVCLAHEWIHCPLSLSKTLLVAAIGAKQGPPAAGCTPRRPHFANW